MKKMLLLSAALIAVLADPALAQDRRGGDRGDRGGQQTQMQRGGGERGGFRGGDRGAFQGGGQRNFGQRNNAQAAPQAQQAPQNFNRGGFGGQRNFSQRDNAPAAQPNFNRGGGNNFAQRNDGQRDFNRGGNNFGGQRDFNRGGSNNFGRNDRFDGRRDFGRNNFGNQRYSQYYRSFNAQRRFRVGRYYGPSGFSYRRWSYGDFLPSLFWSSNYWLNDYYSYDLMPPMPGTVWVRYGDDALLIDRYTGEVIQVAYGIFW